MTTVEKILSNELYSKENLSFLLDRRGQEALAIHRKALEVKSEHVGRKVYFRGLIEYSNRCSKNCFYCGIRASNRDYRRYQLTDEEVLAAVQYAYTHRFGSIVLQAGERSDSEFTDAIERLLRRISQVTNQELHVTLSLGEQTAETYKRWKEAGAHRYLLRIETSNRNLYNKIHPSAK